MTAVPPYGIRVPMLLGGAHAPLAEQVLVPMGFAARTVSTEARRRLRDQAVPQRHHQGPRILRRRKFHGGAGPRRRSAGAGVAVGNLSAVRLGTAGRLPVCQDDPAWKAARGGNASERRDARVRRRRRHDGRRGGTAPAGDGGPVRGRRIRRSGGVENRATARTNGVVAAEPRARRRERASVTRMAVAPHRVAQGSPEWTNRAVRPMSTSMRNEALVS